MKNKNNNGFTLIEVIIYVGIIGLILVSFISFSIVIINSRNQNYITQELQANGRTALEIMTQKIKSASSINIGPSVFNSDPGTLSLAIAEASKNPTIINLNQDDGILQIKEGAADPVAIISDEVMATNLVFTRLATSSPRTNIRIQLTLEFNNPSGDKELDYSQDFQTAVSLRR